MYLVSREDPVTTFVDDSYVSITTRKDISLFGYFGGEYVAVGSDDHRIYIWRVPSVPEIENGSWNISVTEPVILSGHKSIVNSVQFNEHFHFMASSGIEKIIKIWNPLPQSQEDMSCTTFRRRNIYSRRSLMTHQLFIDDESTEESPGMLAYFDAVHFSDLVLSIDGIET